MADPIDYQSVLADLRVRRAALDQAISAIEGLILGESGEVATAPTVQTVANNGSRAPSRQIEPDTFYSLNILEASKKYLGMVGRKAQSTEQIAEALRAGGVQAKTGSVAAILQRAIKANDPDIRRVRPGMWGLAAWYGR